MRSKAKRGIEDIERGARMATEEVVDAAHTGKRRAVRKAKRAVRQAGRAVKRAGRRIKRAGR